MKSSSSWPKDFHAAASYNFLQLLGPKISKNCQREAVLCSCPDMRHQQTNCAHGSSSHLRHYRLLARKLHVDAGVEVCLLVATRTVTSHAAAMVSLQHVGATKNTPSSHHTGQMLLFGKLVLSDAHLTMLQFFVLGWKSRLEGEALTSILGAENEGTGLIHLFWWCLCKGGSYSKLWGGTRIPFQVYTAWKRPHCHASQYRPHWSGPNGSIFNNKNLPIDFKHMSPCAGAPNMSQMIFKWPQWHQPVVPMRPSPSPQGPWSEEAAGQLYAPLWCGAACTSAKCPAKEIYDAAEWCPNTENMKWWLEPEFITEEKSKSIVIRIMVSMVWNVNWRKSRQKSKGFKSQKCRIAALFRSGEFLLASLTQLLESCLSGAHVSIFDNRIWPWPSGTGWGHRVIKQFQHETIKE